MFLLIVFKWLILHLQNGWTSLHFSSKAGYLNVVKLLVESGASTRFETKDGKLPICYAASYNHADVLSYLMHKEHGTQYLMDDKKVSYFDMLRLKINYDLFHMNKIIYLSYSTLFVSKLTSKETIKMGLSLSLPIFRCN